jgi:hypothetical protein
MKTAIPGSIALCLITSACVTTSPVPGVQVDSGRYRLEGNTLVSVDGAERIEVSESWLSRDAGPDNDYVPTADFAADVATFTVLPDVLGAYVSSYGIQKEGSAGIAWGRDVVVAIDTKASAVIGRLSDPGTTKSRGKYMGCIYARNDIFFLGDLDEDGATDIAVLPEEIRCTEIDDEANDVTRVIATHSWGTMKWYLFNGTDWQYSATHDNHCSAQQLIRPQDPALFKSPVDFALEMNNRRVARQTTPVQLATCIR